MRAILTAVVTLVVFGSTVGKAQVFQSPTPVPQVTAANADWQVRGDPVFFAGDFYHPTGPTVFFDGAVMVRSGTFQGVPLYSDATLEPYSVVYLPIGRNVMRPYERRRAGELAGTVGSRTPSFPIERDPGRSSTVLTGAGLAVTAGIERDVVPEAQRPIGMAAEAARPVGTGGTVTTPRAVGTTGVTPSARPAPSRVQSIPEPRSNAGVWLEFNGARWYSTGSAVSNVPGRFVRIGTYRGFPVYRDTTRQSGEIYIPSVDEGPLAPYARR